MRSIICLLISVGLMGGQFVYADDLLSILEGEESDGLIQEKSELVEALTKELGASTAEQNIFFSFLNKDQWESAFFQWRAAFENSQWSQTPTGQSLYAYLLYKNKLEVIGLEALFSVEHPQKIHPILQRIWRQAAPRDHQVWSYVNVKWQEAWTKVFDMETEVRVASRKDFNLENKEEIYEILKKSKLGTDSRHWLEWQMALSLALNEEQGKAAKVLAHLLKSSQNVISQNLIIMTAARLLYESGYLDAALQYYNKIPKSSEYWFIAQEEKAWTYMRKGQPQDTLAVAQSLLVPEFTPHVGPEMMFLTSLAQLKVCDYEAVAKTILDFKRRFQQRAKSLLTIVNNGATPASNQLLQALRKGRVRLLDLGPAALELPSYVSRDEVLLGFVETQEALEKEAAAAADLYARSLSGGTSEVGFQAHFEQLKKLVDKRSQAAKSASMSLLQQRAQDELLEIEQALQKMHIVEAELIQQASLSDRVAKAAKPGPEKLGTTRTAHRYDLKFPFIGEKWFDELSNYKIDIRKACVSRKASL